MRTFRTLSLAVAGSTVILGVPVQSGELTASRIDGYTLSNSIKCEIGKFAGSLKGPRSAKIKPEKMTAKVSISDIRTTDSKAGGELNLYFFRITGKRVNQQSYTDEDSITYNIHSKNRATCALKNRIELGIFDCLNRKEALFLDAAEVEGSISCKSTVSVTTALGAGGKIQTLTFAIGADFSKGSSGTFTVGVSAPAAKARTAEGSKLHSDHAAQLNWATALSAGTSTH